MLYNKMAEFLICTEVTSQPNGIEKTEENLKYKNGAERNCHPVSNIEINRNEYYKMDHKYRGKAIIFSHEQFEIDLKPRYGTTKDARDLHKTLMNLGFSVDVFHNLKYRDIMTQIKKTAKMNHSENDCLLIAVLTHGESGMLYAADMHYKSEKLWCRFTEQNCPTLIGKPKLFFFQACQGDHYDSGITLSRTTDEIDGWFEPHKNPTQPDFLVVLATVPGFFSWRNTLYGSWFIQALCEELFYSASDMDILTLLTLVNQKVALNFQSHTPKKFKSHNKKQVPSISSMLTRRLVFTKKPDNSPSLDSNNMNSYLRHFKECKLL